MAAHAVTSPTGRTVRPDDLDMQSLCNGDQHTAGGSLNRSGYIITAAR